MKENTFIRLYNSAIDLDYCDSLVKKFESHSEQHEHINDKNLSLTQINIFNYSNWKKDTEKLGRCLIPFIDKYKSEFSEHCFPKKYGFEPFKMKRYLPNEKDEFGWHVDVRRFKNIRRFLAMFIYLSDNEEGKTEFDYQDVITDCAKGSMVIFPPMWPWLHRGTKPIKTPKYFMGGYLHYIE